MTTLLMWIVALLILALLLTGHIAFAAWRYAKYVSEDRYSPHTLRQTIREIIFRTERTGDLNGLAEARDAMAAGFQDAEAVFVHKVPGHQRARVVSSDGAPIYLRSVRRNG